MGLRARRREDEATNLPATQARVTLGRLRAGRFIEEQDARAEGATRERNHIIKRLAALKARIAAAT